MNIRIKAFTLVATLLLLISSAVSAQDELTFRCYQDGVECDVYEDLLSRFTEETGIAVSIDVVPYENIRDQLSIQVEAGEAPDIARITNRGTFRGHYLDMTEYASEETVAYWQENYNAGQLAALTNEGEGIGGFPDSFSVTGPFVNVTLFELAEVELPDFETATWQDWTEATTAVQAALTSDELPIYGILMDPTGHRFAGPAMTMGATLIDEDGNFTVDSEGFRAMAELLKSWHESDLTADEVWITQDRALPRDLFINGQAAVWETGNWNVNPVAEGVGDNFQWIIAPNPQGEGGSTGVAGGAALAAFNQTSNPEGVTAVMEYLSSVDIASEFAARTLWLSGNASVAEAGVDFQVDNPAAVEALNVFASEIPKLQDQAAVLDINPFAFAYYGNSTGRLVQYIIGELTLDEALAGLQEDIDDAVAAAE